jgi:hypothetical protein
MSNDNSPALNGYVCFFRNRRTEVYASTLLEARDKAAAFFKAKKSYEVTAVLSEKNQVPVSHATDAV